jgi:hypothetical protein
MMATAGRSNPSGCSVAAGIFGTIRFLWRPTLPDPRDEFILEVAVAANRGVIVTHNVRDFEGARRFQPRVVTPSAFLGMLEKQK